MMADNQEQRVCVKFGFLLRKSAAETVSILQETSEKETSSSSILTTGLQRVVSFITCYIREGTQK